MPEKQPFTPQHGSGISQERPVRTPIRNQIAAAIYSAWIVLKWAVQYLTYHNWWWLR